MLAVSERVQYYHIYCVRFYLPFHTIAPDVVIIWD
jgi:hypothetical protein